MTYKKIIKKLAEKENVSVNQIEKEMNEAMKFTSLDCSAKEFISFTSNMLKDYI